MRKRLHLKVGHKQDQFFAVELPKPGEYLIRKVFYTKQKCVDFISTENKEWRHEVEETATTKR